MFVPLPARRLTALSSEKGSAPDALISLAGRTGHLAQLRANGFSWPPDHAGALIAMGRLVCDDLGWGWTYDQIANDVHANLDPRNVTFGDVHSMVSLASLAHSTCCPNQRCSTAQC